ncbi:hypothetical protein PHLCEN_2v1454 [Hermanssonia centrifuga]|uniref:Flavin-containing monooxygenase n=1 Tax=Hermanssonia centrifuga TaxID=98765 RepID=A0A2R6RZZ7_9APHY|nr:hypothetical protein PHLCEN_2v1454 [Hermanssonia centrifuga]
MSPALKPTLPTLDKLGVAIPQDLDVEKVAKAWLESFSQFVSAKDTEGIISVLDAEAWWRDLFALTWDLRTFHGPEEISAFLENRLEETQFGGIKFIEATLDRPYPDLAWITVQFAFETGVAAGRSVTRLIPSKDGAWKAFVIATNLESLKDHPERVGALRNHLPNHGKWVDQRRKEQEFADHDPEVLIIGGGQSGLDVAARLKHLGTSHLIIEKQPRIGNQWRHRYEALCLHDPLADWLEFYAGALELNVWTSSTVTNATHNEETGKWAVTVKREDGSERVFQVDHVVFALGLGGGAPKVPDIPGKEEFQGQILHSTAHRSAKDHLGKKVVIVGACTSAHDIAADYADHGVDVTIFQRSSTYIMSTKEGMPRMMSPLFWEGGPPTETADRLDNSLPILFTKLLAQRKAATIHEADKELLEGLKSVGYRTNFGVDDSGFVFLALKRAGGYYLDVGACQKIIDGQIKIKNDSQIERFTRTGLKFENGSEIEADVVLFATGFDDYRGPIRKILGEEVGKSLTPIWGLNDEGELRTAWREVGVPNVWYMMGNLAWARFFSKHVALRTSASFVISKAHISPFNPTEIKAKQEGLFGTRYPAPTVW